MQYTPFNSSIDELKPDDLNVLKSVKEGWYVEYKSCVISASKFAKAISAFANTYGGWLFLGVQERSREDPVAEHFPGIPLRDLDLTLQRLRQSSVEHLNPIPYFNCNVLRGPCVSIGLDSEHAIVAVEIPQSNAAPHVHKDARIYRRSADSSEPKPESDRFILDQLWRRGDRVRETVKDLISKNPEFSAEEESIPYLRLLLNVDPWAQRNLAFKATLKEIRQVFTSNEGTGSYIPFDAVYLISDGIVARQLGTNNPRKYTLTWKLRYDLSSDIMIPLPLHKPTNLLGLKSILEGYKYAEKYTEILKRENHSIYRVIDISILYRVLPS